ncbi:MAG TPA: TonB-dependent receptor [Candidatus Baltobacteraceae bacterium]|nr:TonB-dependent receptor [Candidatus Baltobacteraceae bacterium]
MQWVWKGLAAAALTLLLLCAARATVFGAVRGVVHDPQHRPIAGARVLLKSATSDWSQETQTDSDGEFTFPAVAFGDYSVTASAPGFAELQQSFALASDTSSVLHLQLSIAAVTERTTVTSEVGTSAQETFTPTTTINREDIEQTPGAGLTNSLAMITDFTPAAYLTHDMLHMRGGHQTSWLIDGVPIPDTNIATSLAPRVVPGDIDYVEVLRGSYDAQYGDRTYGMFNILPKSGFDMSNEATFVTTFGSFDQTDDQLSFGGHSQRFAYYASVNGNRSNLGLETPVAQVYHDADNGYGGFTSLMYNLDQKDQLRFDGQLRQDYYQIPYDPDPDDFENGPNGFDTHLLRDHELETDGYVLFSWVHTFNPDVVLTVSPFYHYNSSGYHSPATDVPIATTAVFSTNYGGGQAVLSFHAPRNDAQVGVYSFAASQHENFGLIFNDGSDTAPIQQAEDVPGDDIALFASDKFSVTSWLTLIGGLRATHFSGGVTENTTYPRIGGTIRVPHLNWVFRAFWGKFYQPPPLVTISGPLLEYLATLTNSGNETSFEPLHGERDEEHQFGVTIPIYRWSVDIDNFETRGVDFLDHNNIGESSVFIPVTFSESRIRGTELTIRSPRVWNRAQVHLAYSNQIAQAQGTQTGGLILGSPIAPPGWGALDHDQRNTLNVGGEVTLPWQAYFGTNIYYGSGFSNGEAGVDGSPYQAPYLPGHAQVDLSLGKQIGERYSFSVTALNVANRHLLIDNSLTFGGFHYDNPREVYGEFRIHFHY